MQWIQVSLKAKSLNENKYNHIIKFLEAYINNNQNDLDKFKLKNGAIETYNEKQLKLFKHYESAVKNATSLKSQFDNWYLSLPILSFNGSKYDIKTITIIITLVKIIITIKWTYW